MPLAVSVFTLVSDPEHLAVPAGRIQTMHPLGHMLWHVGAGLQSGPECFSHSLW